MTDIDRRKLKQRVNRRKRNQAKRVALVRTKENVIAKTLYRSGPEVARLLPAVTSQAITSARAKRDKQIGLIPVVRKHKKKVPKLLPKNRGRNRFSMRALRTALANIEEDIDKVPIFEHFVRRAYENDNVLKALLSKLLPDLKSIDAKIIQDSPYRLIIDLSGRPQLQGGEEHPMLMPGVQEIIESEACK